MQNFEFKLRIMLYRFYLILNKFYISLQDSLGISTFKIYDESIPKKIIKLRNFVNKYNLKEKKVFNKIRIDTPPPLLFPKKFQTDLVSPGDYYDFPSVYIAKLDKARVYLGTNLIFLKDSVVCHDLYNPRQDYTSEELHGLHTLSSNFTKISRSNKAPLKTINIKEGASFNDACASNYAHWLTEVLPRIAVFCSTEQHKNIPLIVDAGYIPT